MADINITIQEKHCHPECHTVTVHDGTDNLDTIEFNVSDLTGFRYIECNICGTNIAHSIGVDNPPFSPYFIHPTIDQAILHAWSHVQEKQ